MHHEYSGLPNPPFLDLQQVLEGIGPAGALILRDVVENTPEVPPDRSMYKPGQKAWLGELETKILQTWDEKVG